MYLPLFTSHLHPNIDTNFSGDDVLRQLLTYGRTVTRNEVVLSADIQAAVEHYTRKIAVRRTPPQPEKLQLQQLESSPAKQTEELQFQQLENSILKFRQLLRRHPVYTALKTLADVKHFMRFHIYAVWDFMSLLKSLQIKLTCVQVPWNPAGNPTACRLINEIVLDEESDYGPDGEVQSHYEIYRQAAEDLGVELDNFDRLRTSRYPKLFLEQNEPQLTSAVVDFCSTTFEICECENVSTIAAAFALSREDAIPEMFLQLAESLEQNGTPGLGKLIWYLNRHVEVDGDRHGPMARKMVIDLCGTNEELWIQASFAVRKAINARIGLWTHIFETLPSRVDKTHQPSAVCDHK